MLRKLKALVFALMFLLPISLGSSNSETAVKATEVLTLMMPDEKLARAPIYRKGRRIQVTEHSHYQRGSFLGFELEGRCNTKISDELYHALETWSGPKTTITSLKRF